MRFRSPLPMIAGGLIGWAFGIALAGNAWARQGEPPYSLAHPAKVGFHLLIEDVDAVDVEQQRKRADERQSDVVAHSKRMQVAVARPVSISPARQGRWDDLADGSRLWRVRVRAAGATDLRLGFDPFALPAGATLYVIGADDYYQGPYTQEDAGSAGFRTPVVPGDIATIELRLPPGAVLAPDALTLTRIDAGFRDVFGQKQTKGGTGPGASGACNIDVVCPLGNAYPDEIRATGHYEFIAADDNQSYVCTGTLTADVPHTRRNLFLTAAHCMATASEAASMTVYWNYQSTACGQLTAPAGGFFNDDQHGASLRATRADTDVTLVELTGSMDPAWNLHYAGWDATGIAPGGTIGIHHPSGDVKKITAGPRPQTMENCVSTTLHPGTHWRAGPYTQGTTEGGSSGSGLFAAAGGEHARLLIGTLSGGTAGCSAISPSQPDDGYDCYGKLSLAWNGQGAAMRLRDWLDPANTGTTSITGIDQNAPDPDPGHRHSTHAIPAELLRSRRR